MFRQRKFLSYASPITIRPSIIVAVNFHHEILQALFSTIPAITRVQIGGRPIACGDYDQVRATMPS